MSVLGHRTLAEAERYTREADRAQLATDAVIKLERHKANGLAQTKAPGFEDKNSGRHDAFTLCIGHRSKTKDGSFEADVIRAIRPPFDPKTVVAEFAALLKQYRLTKCTGDRYSAEWCVSASENTASRTRRAKRARATCTSKFCRYSHAASSQSRTFLH